MELSNTSLSTQTVNVNQVKGLENTCKADILAVEEPLEIRIEFGPPQKRIKKTISITMRTPGHDFELALGFLFTEGILKSRNDFKTVKFCGASGNVVRIELIDDLEFDIKTLERHFYTSSSCGVCGKTSIEALRVQSPKSTSLSSRKPLEVSSKTINELSQKLRDSQRLFDFTGAIHGCAAFDSEGRLLESREDVGRHNALDKLIGFYFLNGKIPLAQQILLVSGRASFELVQKASMAGFKFFAAVGAPSSLAVELAKEMDMTLLGFVREERFNIYSGKERVKS
jgi:FdhD protein